MNDKGGNVLISKYDGPNRFYICDELLIGDMIQYQKDKDVYLFDKLCMVQVENAELLLTCLGVMNYFKHVKKVVFKIYEQLKILQMNGILFGYIIGNSTFIVVGRPETDKELFLNIIEHIRHGFEHNKTSKGVPPIVVRFAVILNQNNLVERAIEELYSPKNNQKSFVLCDSVNGRTCDKENELRMIEIIHWAMENDGVIPYYQGIYDNKKKGMDKYEALMRITDADGNVYAPAAFMGIAKKYHIYPKLSEMLIRRVFAETDDTNIEVSINLSAFDIRSSKFREMIFELLRQRKSQALLVFEILEDEIFEDIAPLKNFISDVDHFGVKIAIDDFGSGYSNLLQIAQMVPSYIKIDGGIIRKLNDTKETRFALESILCLAERMNSMIVAEYVESEEIQRCVEAFGIEFSQGYYFSTPMTLDKLLESRKDTT